MAVLTAFADASPANAVGTWNNQGNLVSDNGSFCDTTPAKNGTNTLDANGFDFSALGVADVINSVTVTAGGKVSVTTSIDTIGVQVRIAGLPIGTEATSTTWTTTDGNTVTQTPTLTAAQLKDSTFLVRIRASRGNTNTAFRADFDFVSITVDYTPVVVHDLVIADSVVTSHFDQVALSQLHVLGVADSAVVFAVDQVALTQLHLLAVADSAVTAHFDEVALTQAHVLLVADSVVVVAFDEVALTQDGGGDPPASALAVSVLTGCLTGCLRSGRLRLPRLPL